jgi:hypothetical protein
MKTNFYLPCIPWRLTSGFFLAQAEIKPPLDMACT